MRNEVTVKKDELYKVYQSLKDSMMILQLMLAEVGCVHSNSIEVTTMDGTNTRKFFCQDCGETIEEEINNELVEF